MLKTFASRNVLLRSPLSARLLQGICTNQRTFTSTSVDLDYEEFNAPTSPNQAARESSDAAGPLLICHGLFGSKQNWRTLCRVFAKNLNRPVFAVDLRNHGTSPHHELMDYNSMAGDILKFCQERSLSHISLLGHSMGGKVAMAFALNPELPAGMLSRLIVADVSPAKGAISDEFKTYIRAMKEIEATNSKSRKEADDILQKYEPDQAVRQFLLTNLIPSTKDSPQRFRVPLDIIDRGISGIGDFPYEVGKHTWDGKTLFIKGAKSKYINRKNIPVGEAHFPNSRLEILDAGHWVHAERPREFVKLVTDFIDSP